MEDTLTSFETAKLAKEKEFDEKVYREYDKFGYLRCTSKSADVVLGPYDELLKSTEYPAPTQSLLQKWLRNVHNIHITILRYKKGKYYLVSVVGNDENESPNDFTVKYKIYEEALEIGLQEALKLIK